MNIEVGTDIIDINRIRESIDRFGDRFLQRYLNDSEIKLIKRVETAAGFWAAKEAISKALGVGIGNKLHFKDITILKNDNNSPHCKIISNNFDIISSSISISHERDFAIAIAIIVFKFK
jgi:holo-[acyl-carrier protein] synthase